MTTGLPFLGSASASAAPASRRETIERELREIEGRMSVLARHCETSVRERATPAAWIRRHWGGALGASVVGGIVLSLLLGGKASRTVITGTVRSLAARWISRAAARAFTRAIEEFRARETKQ